MVTDDKSSALHPVSIVTDDNLQPCILSPWWQMTSLQPCILSPWWQMTSLQPCILSPWWQMTSLQPCILSLWWQMTSLQPCILSSLWWVAGPTMTVPSACLTKTLRNFFKHFVKTCFFCNFKYKNPITTKFCPWSYSTAVTEWAKVSCGKAHNLEINGLVHDCSNSSALAMELLQSCTKPSQL